MELLLTLIVGFFIVIGVLIGYFEKNNNKFNALSIGLAFGVIITLVLGEILPESYEILIEEIQEYAIILIILFIILGITILKLLDFFIPHHEHEHKHHHNCQNKCHTEHLTHIGIIASIALILHNIIEGMTLYVTTTTSIEAGLLLCLGIGLHNLPLGFIISTTLKNKKEIVWTTILVSISTFIGGLLMLAISSIISNLLVGILLTITLGMLIYISVFELLPQIINSNDKKYSLIGIISGILILLISIALG